MPELRGARAMVTGGAGMIGSALVDQLVLNGAAEVVVIDNLVRGRPSNLAWAQSQGNVILVEGDIRDRRVVQRAMKGIDLVFHQAALRITQCAERPREALEVLVDGSYNVFEAAVEAGVRRVVAASSASVYGEADVFPTPESHHPWHNRTFYGAAKAFNEGMLRTFQDTAGLDWVALRYFNVYGPRMDAFGVYTEVLVRWIERIDAGLRPIVFGDGAQSMDFVYVSDVAEANIAAARAHSVEPRVFNVASGRETTLMHLADALLRVMDARSAIEHAAPRPINAVKRRLADVTLARTVLGFEARVDLDEGLARLVDWWREEVREAPEVSSVPRRRASAAGVNLLE